MVFINGSTGIALDTTSAGVIANKVGIDATKPIGNDKVMSEMVHLGREYPTDSVDLEAYIGRWHARRAVAPGTVESR